MEHETVEKITQALRAGGFTQIETRESTSSLTVSAAKCGITAIVYLNHTEAYAIPRSSPAGRAPVMATRATVPRPDTRSGSGT